MFQTSSSSVIVIITDEKNCGNSHVFKHVGFSKNFQKDGRKADSSHKVWPPSYACAQPYHPGGGNHIVHGACFYLEPFPPEAEYSAFHFQVVSCFNRIVNGMFFFVF